MRLRWLLLPLLVACAAEEPAPMDILPRDRFRDVLLKAHVVEARLNHEMRN